MLTTNTASASTKTPAFSQLKQNKHISRNNFYQLLDAGIEKSSLELEKLNVQIRYEKAIYNAEKEIKKLLHEFDQKLSSIKSKLDNVKPFLLHKVLKQLGDLVETSEENKSSDSQIILNAVGLLCQVENQEHSQSVDDSFSVEFEKKTTSGIYSIFSLGIADSIKREHQIEQRLKEEQAVRHAIEEIQQAIEVFSQELNQVLTDLDSLEEYLSLSVFSSLQEHAETSQNRILFEAISKLSQMPPPIKSLSQITEQNKKPKPDKPYNDSHQKINKSGYSGYAKMLVLGTVGFFAGLAFYVNREKLKDLFSETPEQQNTL